jgi:hypothetical protein
VVEASSKSDLFERKLRCAFLMPPGTPANQSGAETNKPATDQPAKDTSVSDEEMDWCRQSFGMGYMYACTFYIGVNV